MTQTIQIKRRITAAGQPDTLAPGELFHNNIDKTLSVGDATGVPQLLVSSTRQVEIEGTQSINGVKTIPVANLKLLGGTTNQFLKTDGIGNVSFATIPPPIPPISALPTEMDAGTRNDVFGTPLNTRYIIGASVSALQTTAKAVVPAINELHSAISQMGTGNIFVGQFSAGDGSIAWTVASGASGNTLPAAAPANIGWQLICNVSGTVPPGGAPAGTYSSNDWLLSDGTNWNHLAFGGTSTVLASNVTVSPAVAGGSNVQASLEGLQNNKVDRAGDTMSGPLTVPVLNISPPAGNYSEQYFKSGGVSRWLLRGGDPANTSNFEIHRYGPAGAYLGAGLVIDNATGAITGYGATTINGSLYATGNVSSAASILATGSVYSGGGVGGTVYLGNTGTHYLTFDGTQYVLANASLSTGNITCGSITNNGTEYFINGNNYLITDGTNLIARTIGSFYVQNTGGALGNLITGSANLGAIITTTINMQGNTLTAGPVNCGSVTATGNVASSGFLNAGYTSDYGVLYFGNTASRYIEQNGAQFTFVGGRLNVNSDIHATGNMHADGGNFFMSATAALTRAAPYTNIYNGSGIGFITGDGSEPSNYYRNARHMFQSQAGADYFAADAGGCVSYGYLNANGNCTIIGQLRIGSNADSSLMHFGNTNVRYISQVAENVQMININLEITSGSMHSGGDIQTGGRAFKPGGGAWEDLSDARIKNVTGDYTAGLDAILALSPKKFTYKGNDTAKPPSNSRGPEEVTDKTPPVVPYMNSNHYAPAAADREFIGLIAQEAEIPMPEMVEKIVGYIDGATVDDLRSLDTTPLIFALVNAVKTLAARVEALETGT